jgi:predicted Zn-dependent peptidase
MRTRTRTTIATGVLAAGATIALAQAPPGAPASQAPPSSKAVVLKGKAPVSNDLLRVKLPRPQEADLPNGLHLIVLEDRRVPRITVQLLIPGAGGYYDPADLPGAGNVTSAMMREGTATRSSAQISEQLETMAATLTVSTGMSSTEATVSGSCLTEHAGPFFDIFADVLLNPSFPEEELSRYKQRTRAGLLQQRSIAGFLGAEMFARVMYASHPAGRISLTPEGLDKMTAKALTDFHRTRYAPDHAALAIAGDISLAEARKLVETRLGAWKKTGSPAPPVSEPPAPGGTRVTFVARPNSVQTNLLVGTQAIRRLDPDYDTLQVMNKVIGGGPTGRLFIILREEKGYTYGAYSGLSAGQWRGAWQASTEVRTEVTEDALRDLLKEVARLRDEPVPDKEFNDHKRAMVGSFALSLENPQQMIGYYVTSWRFRLPPDYWDKYPARIAAVTKAQVQAAAKKYLDPARLQIIAVGEPTKIADLLKSFGKVDTYDTEGKPVASASD